jgi:uncharacterized protein
MIRTALVLGLSFFAAGAAHAASFDCAKAEAPDEKAICADPALNDADVRMATMFEMETRLVAMGQRDVLRDQQKSWLESRQACNADVACLTKAYDRRLADLVKVFDEIVSRGPF